MDAASIKAAVDGTKTAIDFLKGQFNSRVDAAAQPKIQESLRQLEAALSALYDMQTELFGLQIENQQLKLERLDRDAWRASSERYAIFNAPGGAVVYKSADATPHYACPRCFAKREIQVLQGRSGYTSYDCPSCKTQYAIDPEKPMEPLLIYRG